MTFVPTRLPVTREVQMERSERSKGYPDIDTRAEQPLRAMPPLPPPPPPPPTPASRCLIHRRFYGMVRGVITTRLATMLTADHVETQGLLTNSQVCVQRGPGCARDGPSMAIDIIEARLCLSQTVTFARYTLPLFGQLEYLQYVSLPRTILHDGRCHLNFPGIGIDRLRT